MFGIFKKFSLFRKSPWKSLRKSNESKRALAREILVSADIDRIDELQRYGIHADMDMGDGETIGTFALQELEIKRQNIEAPLRKFYQSHANTLVALDMINAVAESDKGNQQQYLRAAAFLNSQEFLEKLGVDKKDFPAHSVSMQDLKNAATDPDLMDAETRHDNLSHLTHVIFDAENYDALYQNTSVAKPNAKGDTPQDMYENYAHQYGALVNGLGRKNEAAIIYQMLEQGIGETELAGWANDPILQRQFPVLKQFASIEYNDAFYQQMETAAQRAAQQQQVQQEVEQQAEQDQLQMQANTGFEIIETHDVSRIDELTALDIVLTNEEDGTINNFTTIAASEFAKMRDQEESAKDSLLEYDSGTLQALADISTMDKTLIGDAHLLHHEAILTALDIPQDQWPKNFIAHESGAEMLFIKNETAKANEIAKATLQAEANQEFVEQTQAYLHELEGAVADNINERPVDDFLFDNLAATQGEVYEELSKENPLKDLQDRLTSYAQLPEMVEALPYLKNFAPQENNMEMEAEAEVEMEAEHDNIVAPAAAMFEEENDQTISFAAAMLASEHKKKEATEKAFVENVQDPSFTSTVSTSRSQIQFSYHLK